LTTPYYFCIRRQIASLIIGLQKEKAAHIK